VSRFNVTALPLAGLKWVARENRGDARGFLSRLFCAEELAAAGWRKPVAQINQTVTTRRGVVRGMHFQNPPHAEMKLVTCLRGAIFDVAVDLRHGSPTFLRWHGEELSSDNRKALLIPEGFAHGFQTLSDDCELIYVHSTPYRADAEGGVSPRDAVLAIAWPLAISELSDRDARHPPIDAAFTGITL
jgi:dTDP-4-dehydrorhamnose 3,5-epimerase